MRYPAYVTLHTPYSTIRIPYSVLHIQCSMFRIPYSIFHSSMPHSILQSQALHSMLHPPSSILHTILFNPYSIPRTANPMLARLDSPYAVLHIEYSMFHIPHPIFHIVFQNHYPYTIFCAPYCIIIISASTARLQRRVHMDGHKLCHDVRKMMPAVDGSKVSGVEEAKKHCDAPKVPRW